MSDALKKPADARTIYMVGYNKKVVGAVNSGSKCLDAKTFFNSMSKAIIYEYEQQGFCEFIDETIESRFPVDIIVYAAILNAKAYFNGEGVENNAYYVPYVRITDNRKGAFSPTWDDFNRIPMNDQTFDYRMIRDMLLELRNAGKKAHLAWIEKKESKHQDRTSVSIEDERNKKSNHTLDSEVRHAEFKPDETLRMAENYLVEGRQITKNELNIEVANMLIRRDSQIGLMEKIHDEMRDETDSIHAAWSEELTNAISNLSKMKEELYEHIHKWQISLYPYEIEPLAQRYIELYKIINVEKIIDQEVLFAYSRLKLQDGRELQEEETTDENDRKKGDEIGEQVKTTIDGLQKINRSLTIFLKKFEASLNGLGMYVYYPKEMEQFDDILHILENGEDGMGLTIKRCIVPGVAKKINGGEDADVIIPAIVEV